MRFRCSIWRHFEREYEVQRRRWLSIRPGCSAVIQHSAGVLQGYMTGFSINAAVLIVSGLLGLLLLWPNSERARLIGQAVQPELAPSN